MRVTYKYRLYPTAAQAAGLTDQLRAACALYNAALEERRGAWKVSRTSLNYYAQANQLKAMRAEGLIAVANFTCCQEILRRVDRTFAAFFARVKRGGAAGYPRFRSARRYDSLTFPTHGNGCALTGNRLRVQGVGVIKVKLHRPVEGAIKTVSIVRDVTRWYVCASVERDAQPLPATDREVGIDVGLTPFATLSTGEVIANPRPQAQAQARLRRAQRRLARRTRGSHRRHKARAQLAHAQRAVRNQRANFHHQVSRRLVNQFGRIAVERLNVKGLSAGRLARSVKDAGWAAFFATLSYKAASAGRVLVEVDARGTSQTCVCGAPARKTLSDRWHACGACGLSEDRDLVSAQVILQRARIEPSWRNVEDRASCVPREAVCFS
ncbi:MAG TPA: transposase [Vicinamibacterales bacterium]|nr:transposase [Vicinamibacterales bacterium]